MLQCIFDDPSDEKRKEKALLTPLSPAREVELRVSNATEQ